MSAHEDYPILSFYSELEFSTCPNENTMENVNMDSLGNFYDTDFEQELGKEEGFFLDSHLPSLADLDPSVELSFDLEDLIKQETSGGSVANTELFPELHAPAASYHPGVTADTHVAQYSASSPAPSAGNLSAPTPSQIIVDDTNEQMPQILKVESSQTASSCPVFSVKHTDLEALGITSSDKKGVVYLQIRTAEKAEEKVSSSSDSADAGTSRNGARNTLKALPAGKGQSRRQNPMKSSDEYKEKRARNNVAVRKSRDKAKIRQQDTEDRVKILSKENDRLTKKCDLLTKELTVLKGLFTNVGATLPKELEDVLE